MEERNTNIEQWLREAAARQEQEQTPAADKQAAWDAMRTQLDQPARGGSAPWKRWFGGALLTGIVLISVLFVVLQNREEKQSTKQEATGGTGTADEGSGRTPTVPGNSPERTATGNRGNAAGTQANAPASVTALDAADKRPARENGTSRTPGGAQTNTTTSAVKPGGGKQENHHQLTVGRANAGNEKAGVNKPAGISKEKTGAGHTTNHATYSGNIVRAGNITRNNTAGVPVNAANKKNNAIKSDGNRLHRTAGSSKAGIVPFHTGSNSADPSKGGSGYNTGTTLPGAADKTGADPTSLHSIVAPPATFVRFNATSDTGLLRTRSRVQGEAPAFAPRQMRHFNPSGLSIQISGNIPLNSSYGANAAVEYTFDFGNGIRLRPHIGAGYLTGFNETYKHRTFNTRSLDPSSTAFLVDSILSTYAATALGFGEAGVQVAYTLNRWELMAGISYRYAFSIQGKEDSTFTSRTDSIRRSEYAPDFFSTGDLPGRGKLMIQAGMSYMFTPQLQGGLRYNLQVAGSRKGAGMLNNPPSLPLKSSIEFQVRWYFRRNNKK